MAGQATNSGAATWLWLRRSNKIRLAPSHTLTPDLLFSGG